jgi:penicillin amidase
VNEIVLKTFQRASQTIKSLDDKQQLNWGKFKNTGIRHLLKIGPFSKSRMTIGGGKNVINAATEDHGPSWRMIVQLTDDVEAYGIYPGGQSGNPGSKYYDNFIETWASGKYYPLLFLKRNNISGHRVTWKMKFNKG